MIRGRCECGAVRLSVDAPIEDFSHCHCGQCRRLHGAAFATFAAVAIDRMQYEQGEDQVATYASSAKNDRHFCAVCGSTIGVFAKDEPTLYYLSMSVVEGDPPRPVGHHSWVGSKAPWHEITDDLEQFEAAEPE